MSHNEEISFCLDTEPRAQQRHRATYIGGRVIKMYNPSSAHKKSLTLQMLPYRKRNLSEHEPVLILCTFAFARPKSHKKNPPIHHIQKPDIDNLSKLILDAMKGLFFVDDCQVMGLNLTKIYTDKNKPYIQVTIRYPKP